MVERRYMRPRTIRDLVDRFLSWKLPQDFGPDCGISFKPPTHPNSWPVGTNLFTAEQARQMLEHILEPALDLGMICPYCEVQRPHTHTMAEQREFQEAERNVKERSEGK